MIGRTTLLAVIGEEAASVLRRTFHTSAYALRWILLWERYILMQLLVRNLLQPSLYYCYR